jgi:hypothetical protein
LSISLRCGLEYRIVNSYFIQPNEALPYLSSNLIFNMRACEISDFVRVANSDIECGLCSLFNADALLSVSFYRASLSRLDRRRYPRSSRGLCFVIVVRVHDISDSLGGIWLPSVQRHRLFLLRRRRWLLRQRRRRHCIITQRTQRS